MDLFSADLESISMADVEQFLAIHSPERQRPMEGTKLDYKLKEPADLGDTVAAFANTSGGLIFIGVESDKLKHNVPISIPGESFAGGDVRARLTGKIIAQVTPRPDVQIGVVPVPQSSTNVVAVIRVSEGVFPPYEFSSSNTVRLPVRRQDTVRQATLRDLEHLFEKRNTFKATADERLGIFDETKPLVPSFINNMYGTETYVTAKAYQTWMVRPRISPHIRLDRAFDIAVRKTIQTHFIDTTLGDFYPPIMTSDSHVVRWQSSISDQSLGTIRPVRLFQYRSDGGIRFTEKIDRHDGADESISDLFIQSLRFLRFAKDFYSNYGYFGSMSVAQRVDCPSPVDFYRNFPDQHEQYHSTNTIVFLGKDKGRASGSSRISREIDLETEELEALVCDFMLAHLRQLCHASVDYDGLHDLIRKLPSNVRGIAFF